MSAHNTSSNNRLDINGQDELFDAIRTNVSTQLADFINAVIDRPCDRAVLCDIHRTIFRDVYDVAGQVRTASDPAVCAMGRPMTDGVYASSMLDNLCREITETHPHSPREALRSVAEYWGKMTMIHPFRDGNSRSQTIFFNTLATQWGIPFDFLKIDPHELHAARYMGAFHMDYRYLEHALSRGVAGCEPANNEKEHELFQGKGSEDIYRLMVEDSERHPDGDIYRLDEESRTSNPLYPAHDVVIPSESYRRNPDIGRDHPNLLSHGRDYGYSTD